MSKFVSALIVALVAVWGLVGSATSASAHYRHGGYHQHGCCGGPIPPTYVYKTIHPHKYYTRYHDRSVYKYVPRIHRIIYVTRVQPIIRTHIVTRIHHHTIYYTRNVYEHVVQHLPPIRTTYGSVQHTYDCGCGGGHHHHYGGY